MKVVHAAYLYSFQLYQAQTRYEDGACHYLYSFKQYQAHTRYEGGACHLFIVSNRTRLIPRPIITSIAHLSILPQRDPLFHTTDLATAARERVGVLLPEHVTHAAARNDLQRAAALPHAERKLCRDRSQVRPGSHTERKPPGQITGRPGSHTERKPPGQITGQARFTHRTRG